MSGLHAAIIMDGNGRWAVARGKSRPAGHLAGADAVRRTVEAAPGLGVSTLTLYAFSSDNWRRPPEEVGTLMRLLRRYLMAETGRCIKNGVRVQVIGRRDRLSTALVREIEAAEHATSRSPADEQLLLRIAVDYSARDAILRAAQCLWDERATGSTSAGGGGEAGGAGELSRERFSHLLAGCAERRVHDVDLLIRTGGEKRLSDFLLWECAYAELIFTERMWPDFGVADLAEAVEEFRRRERRFGGVGGVVGVGSFEPVVAVRPAATRHAGAGAERDLAAPIPASMAGGRR
jgi:undecaprenyl diphosphate synthase